MSSQACLSSIMLAIIVEFGKLEKCDAIDKAASCVENLARNAPRAGSECNFNSPSPRRDSKTDLDMEDGTPTKMRYP